MKQGFHKVWFLDAQGTDCPKDVEARVREMWIEHELGNDNCVINTTLEDLQEDEENRVIVEWILNKDPLISHLEQIIIHWWW